MKTAGFNLLSQLQQVLPPGACCPPPRETPPGPEERWRATVDYLTLSRLEALAPAQRGRLRLVAGHLPFAVHEMLDPPAAVAPAGAPTRPVGCIVLLREPVARSLSLLAQIERTDPAMAGRPLEAIYEEPWFLDRYLRHHQTRMLSMTLDEARAPGREQLLVAETLRRSIPVGTPPEVRARIDALIGQGNLYHERTQQAAREVLALGVEPSDVSHLADQLRDADVVPHAPETAFAQVDSVLSRPSPVDATRLEVARRNLTRSLVVGVTEDYRTFVADLNRASGLEVSGDGRANVGRPIPAQPASFLRRLREDTAFDLELYEAARTLAADRHR